MSFQTTQRNRGPVTPGSGKTQLLLRLLPAVLLLLTPAVEANSRVVSHVLVDPTKQVRGVPSGYFGYSYDWGDSFTQVAENAQWYVLLAALKKTGSASPLTFRIGAYSSDFLTSVPNQAFWNSISRLHQKTSCQFIFCLPLRVNNPPLAVKIIRKVYQTLPKKAVIGFEVGNEPIQWPDQPAGFWPQGYMTLLKRTLQFINLHAHGTPLIGLASHTTYLTPDIVQPIINELKPYHTVGMTAHLYAANPNSQTEDSVTLLNDDHIQPIHNLISSKFLATSLANKLWFRMDEVNTEWNNGKKGVSNSFSAALWTLDMYFTIASYGVRGVNCFSQPGNWFDAFTTKYKYSHALGNYVTITPATTYYGHWMWQEIMDGNMKLLNAKQYVQWTNIKTWTVMSSNRQVRVVVLNKSLYLSRLGSQYVTVDFPGNLANKIATQKVLKAPKYWSTSGVTYGGLSADPTQPHYAFTKPARKAALRTVKGVYHPATRTSPALTRFTFVLGPVSASVLTVKWNPPAKQG